MFTLTDFNSELIKDNLKVKSKNSSSLTLACSQAVVWQRLGGTACDLISKKLIYAYGAYAKFPLVRSAP